ncbi:NHL repeat-containing protein [Actinidia chinensis var. chinensis]|uniref:NHL repeat-containing protein n=1 Tax=Actinidia chinensis var. chinensis TaxID=1590841 RepID=A0A2R6PQ50_ACTCC|nr:NHL repeat-containing protein [Actinidia chinensis var. chinensis]
MALMFRRLREISRVLPQVYAGTGYLRQDTKLFGSHSFPLPHLRLNNKKSSADTGGFAQRFSTVSETSHESLTEDDLLSFIESTLNNIEGPYHCWVNKIEDSKDFCRTNGVFLVLVGAFFDEPSISASSPVVMFEKVKALQQRYPTLTVMGFQSSSSIFSDAVRTRFVQIATKDYITFPILLSNKNFTEMTDGACFVVFKGFESPFLYYERDVDIGTIDEAIKNLVQRGENHNVMNKMKSTWAKQIEVIKEPPVSASLRNLLLCYPGCISVDEMANHLFLSDINHHRIIIFDDNGKILDCIGSSPGFEDGDFESAKLMRPAASFYHEAEDCLYFVDSENHAVRRADMERRVVETLYPICNGEKKDNSLWSWVMNKLWMKRDVNTKSEDLNSESFLFPWHLIKSLDNDLFIVNRSFEILWIMDLASGEIKEVVKGFPKIVEVCGRMIQEKSSLLKQIPGYWLQQFLGNNGLFEGITYAGLMSSLATFQDHVVICDTGDLPDDKCVCEVGHRVIKLSKESGLISNFHFSNFGILGLPYWMSSSLERVYAAGGVLSEVHIDHVQHFSLLPGRVDIQVNVDIPEDTELVEPLQEGCVWRQARGAATEVSGAESIKKSSEKVGVSQQWYDDLDTLAFSAQEAESTAEEGNTSDGNLQEDGVSIDCTVHTSPGTSEVIIYAVFYLRLKPNQNSNNSTEKKAARIADILNPKRAETMGKDPCAQFLMKSDRTLEELVFMKPLHVRVKLECRDHPKAVDDPNEIVLTESSIEVNVSLH